MARDTPLGWAGGGLACCRKRRCGSRALTDWYARGLWQAARRREEEEARRHAEDEVSGRAVVTDSTSSAPLSMYMITRD